MPPQIIPIQSLSLERYPKNHDKSLQAWNAADELLIDHLQTEVTDIELQQFEQNCLIINDQFGALSTASNQLSPLYWTDSYLSQQAIQTNLKKNFKKNIFAEPFSVDFLNKHKEQTTETIEPFNLVLIRVPKHNSLLEFQLNQIKPCINKHTQIIAAGMTKDIHTNNLKIFENALGKTTTSLAKKKARLIFTKVENNETQKDQLTHYLLTDDSLIKHSLKIYSYPGVFSKNKLDIGTQVLLKYLPEIHKGQKVLDLGCGNGVIGAVIAKRQPNCQLLLSDESQLAIKSAELTFQKNQLNNASFICDDVLSCVDDKDFDHILCNPPFHQQNVQTLSIANNMFKQSAKHLNQQGELRVVANRHLNYQSMLKKYFKQVTVISNDSKFSVWLATHPIRN